MRRKGNGEIHCFLPSPCIWSFPSDSPVEYLSTETVSKKLRLLMSDTRLRVNNDTYIVEAQISFDGDMAIRIFEYGYYSGLWEKTFEDTIRTIKIPPARIIYWEGKSQTPPEQILRLRFPDDSYYDYRVETFEPLKHSVKALEKKGVIEGPDAIEIMTGLERLFRELYGQYDEFVEEDNMLQEKLDLYTDKFKEEAKIEVAKNLLALGDSLEKVAKATGLPLGKVKALLKKAKTRQPA